MPIPSSTLVVSSTPLVAMASTTINKATAVPSLNRLSPSNISDSRFGAP